MMRSTVEEAVVVWRVPRTRCPVSAAVMASPMVSRSRISPTRMTSGSSRSDCRKARAKEREWLGTSRWLTRESWLAWTYSIGSSIVRMWHRSVWLIRSTSAARVVVLPQPAGPVTRTRPCEYVVSSQRLSGSPMSARLHLERNQPQDGGEPFALKKDVRPEPAERRILVAEVELQALVEHAAALGRQNRIDPVLHLRRGRLRNRQSEKLSVQPHVRDGAGREMEVRRADGPCMPEELRQSRFGRRGEVVRSKPPRRLQQVVRAFRARQLLRETRRFLPHERVRIRLDDLREENGHSPIGNPREGVENLETQVLRAALVGVEQRGKR